MAKAKPVKKKPPVKMRSEVQADKPAARRGTNLAALQTRIRQLDRDLTKGLNERASLLLKIHKLGEKLDESGPLSPRDDEALAQIAQKTRGPTIPTMRGSRVSGTPQWLPRLASATTHRFPRTAVHL